jgi:tetratricopeptide (TPR) repeat protein
MAKKRVTRKKLLKEPDEFITFTGKMIQFGKTYQTYLLYGTAALLLLVLMISGTRYYFGWKEKKAAASLSQAVARYENILSEKGDIEAAKEDFKNIVKKYSGYDGGRLARVIYANICFQTGDFDTAISQYTKAVDEFSENPSIKPFIRSSIAYAYQAKKDYKAAANHFEKIVTDPDVTIKDEALFNLGEIYAILGNTEKSREAFKKILSDYTDSIYIDVVKERIAG